MFKNKAIEIADKLIPAFNTPTGIPMAMVNVRTYVSMHMQYTMQFVFMWIADCSASESFSC